MQLIVKSLSKCTNNYTLCTKLSAITDINCKKMMTSYDLFCVKTLHKLFCL